MYKKVVLDNGLSVIMAEMPNMESISIGVWIAAGGRYENMKKSGISHFLEHMVFKGTKSRSCKQLKEAIEGRGGSLNGFTGEEFTCYLAKVLAKHADIALDILCDMTLNPKLDKQDFLKERMVILEEIKMYMDMPSHHVHELLARLLWPKAPLGMPLAGTFDTVSALTQKDLDIYQKNLYNPKNIVIAIAGKPGLGGVIKSIGKYFNGRDTGTRSTYEPLSLKQTSPSADFYFKKTEQTHIAMGLHGFSRFSKNKYSLDLLNIILGGNMSSRLFHEVREKSALAYEISSSVKHYNDTGALVISAGIDNKKVAEALKVIIHVMAVLKKRGCTKEEFGRAKEFYRGQILMLFEETMNHMLWLGEKFSCNDMEYKAADILASIDKIQLEDVQRVARDLFSPGNINLAQVGPASKAVEREITKRLYDL